MYDYYSFCMDSGQSAGMWHSTMRCCTCVCNGYGHCGRTYDGLRTSMCYDSCKCRCMYMTIGHGSLFTLAILRTHSLAMVKLCAVIIQSLSSWPWPYLLTQVPSTSTFQFTAWQDSSMSMLYNLFICMYITGVHLPVPGARKLGRASSHSTQG